MRWKQKRFLQLSQRQLRHVALPATVMRVCHISIVCREAASAPEAAAPAKEEATAEAFIITGIQYLHADCHHRPFRRDS